MIISVLLEALTGKFETDTQRAAKRFQKSIRSMERDASRMGRRLALALSPVALVAITKKSIDFADSIGKTADKLGFNIEKLQEYRFAASQAGIEQNTFDMAMQRFTRRAAEAAQGTGEAKKVLEELGIRLTDLNGKLRPTEDLLKDVADRLKENYGPADRLRIAFKLFDSEGAALVNMLRDGSVGLNEMSRQAREAGVVLDQDLVRNAEQAANKMDELQKVLQVRIAETVTENADSIIYLTESLISFIGKIGRATKGWNDWLAALNGGDLTGVDEIRARMGQIQIEIANLEKGDPEIRIGFTGDETIGERIENLKNEFGELQVKLKNLIAVPFESLEIPEKLTPNAPALLDIGPDPKVVQDRVNQISKIIEGLQDQVSTFGMGDEAALIRLVDLGADQESINQASDLIGQLSALELTERQRTEEAERRKALEAEYAGIVEALQTPTEAHVAEMERIAYLYEEGIIPNVEEYAQALNRATERFDEMNKKTVELDQFGIQAARNMQSTLADFLFDPWEEGVSGMVKGFGEALRRMAAEAAAAAIFRSLFGVEGGAGGILSGGGGGGFGSFIASIFGGARARGGPIVAGRAYLVGEDGPEVVVPRASGHVIPNGSLPALAGGNTYVNNFNLPVAMSRQTAMQNAQEAASRFRLASERNR